MKNVIIITTGLGDGVGTLSQVGINQGVQARVTLIGGGGGTSLNSNRCMGGAGAGGAVVASMDLDPNMMYSIGGGGDGAAGGDTILSNYTQEVNYLVAHGGNPGGVDAGGVGGGGYSMIKDCWISRGGCGMKPFNSINETSVAGEGGNSILGGGGLALPTNVRQNDSHNGFANSGAGGSGANGTEKSSGADGCIIIEY